MTRTAKLPDLSGHNFLKLYQTEGNARGKMRFLAFHHLQQGKNISDVIKLLCITRKALRNWLSWYEEEGIERLRAKIKGRGAKPKITASIEEIQAGILKLQQDRKGGRATADDVLRWIEDEYKVKYHKGHIYNFLAQNGLSWVSSRSKHSQADSQLQEDFKKTLRRK
jgi:transposase